MKNTLVAKLSKCNFGNSRVEYLGHFVSNTGIATDPRKIQASQDWSIPNSVKELRSFLGLAGYYRKFIKNYAVIAKPLTQRLQKASFIWIEATTEAIN